MGDFAITEDLRRAFKEQNIVYYPIRPATPDEFFEAIGHAKEVNPYGPFVTQHSREEYSDMIDMIWDTMDDIPYSITESSIHVQEQYFPTERHGITFVIIDKNTREVVDYALLDVGPNGELELEHL